MSGCKALRFKTFLPLLALLLAACPQLNNSPSNGGNTPGSGGNTPTFEISLDPAELTIVQGESEQITLTITPKDGFTGPVNLSLVNQDGSKANGITLNPTSVNVGGSNPLTQTLTIKVDSDVPAKTYNLKLKATSGNITKEASLTVTVRAQGQPTFEISLDPTELTITQGGSAETELTITPKEGFSGTVSLSLVSPPAGVSLSPSSVTVGSSSVTKTLTISTAAYTPTGQYTLTLEATSEGIRETATLTLTVNTPEFTVNTEADTTDQNPGDGRCEDADGNCSLRAAVMEANALNTPAVINIPAGTYKLTRESSVDELGGDLDIKGEVTLRGAGAGQTILDGNGADRVLEIWRTKVRVEGVTIQNGKATDDGYGGGGIINYSTLALVNSTVSGSTASWGGGISNYGTLTLEDSIVSGNTASYGGGGIYNYGTLTLVRSTVSGNATDYHGGGILNYGGTLALEGSTVDGNTASKYGGGILNAATLTLKGSTVNGNAASYCGGGIANAGTLTLANSTVSGNSASYGGGVCVGEVENTGPPVADLSFSTLTLNRAQAGGGIYIHSGTVRLKGVILGGNTAGSGPECKGSLTSLGYNLIKDEAGCSFTAQDTDITGQDPLLGELTENGGPTKTHLPQANSPVLDKVPTGDCTDLEGNSLATDGRGVTRPQGTACDIGAVERRPSE